MVEKFLARYFLLTMTTNMRNEISSFVQMELETLYDAWERFIDLLRKCLHHGLPVWFQVRIFYTSLNQTIRQMIDVVARGTLNSKKLEGSRELFEKMAMNSYQWYSSRAKPAKTAMLIRLQH